jgi:hypothetical protein
MTFHHKIYRDRYKNRYLLILQLLNMLMLIVFMVVGARGGFSIVKIWPKLSLEKGSKFQSSLFTSSTMDTIIGGVGGVLCGHIVSALIILWIGNSRLTSQMMAIAVSIPLAFLGGAILVLIYSLVRKIFTENTIIL